MNAAAAPAAKPAARSLLPRLQLFDAIKGVACALIVGHHLARYGPMAVGALTLAPTFLGWLAQDGRLAVQVFLVIAGFLAAGSLAPDGLSLGGNPVVRVLRRYVRLIAPYLVALIVSVLVAALVRPWLDGDVVPAAPGMAQLIAHALLLQDLLGYPALSAGVWYVAIDFQLFALAVTVVALSGWLQRRLRVGARRARWISVGLVLLLAIASLALFNRRSALDDTALYFFGAYGLGMLAFWIGRATRPGIWQVGVGSLALLGTLALIIDWRSRIAIALVTALSITFAQRSARSGLQVWPALARPLLHLGQISYSLFLIHFPVILLVNAVVGTLWPMQPWTHVFGMLGALGLSLVAAVWLHRWVEMRPASLREIVFLFAVLLACGALISG